MSRTAIQAARDAAWLARGELRVYLKERKPPSSVEIDGITVPLDDAWATEIIRQGLYRGRYERPEAEAVRATLKPGDRYLEFGAGIGYLATVASKVVGSENVLAFEADPTIAQAARTTAQANNCHPDIRTGVVLRNRAVETVSLYRSPVFASSSLIPIPGAEHIEVPTFDLDAVLAEHAATYLNVDIEGAETDLLVAEIPAAVRVVCVEMHPGVVGDGASTALVRHLIGQGFELHLSLSAGATLLFMRPRRSE